MELKVPLITLDIPFDFADEMARALFSSKQFQTKYTSESYHVSQFRTIYKIQTKWLNRLGEIVLVKFGEGQTKVFLNYEPYPTELVNEYMIALWSQTHVAIDSSSAKIATTPELEAETERKIRTVADKYRHEYEMRMKELSVALQFYLDNLENLEGISKVAIDRNPLEDVCCEVQNFKLYIERQSCRDIFVNGKPQESIARALLQAFLTSRSYREVEVRGGKSDLLSFVNQGRFLFETKIWRGIRYFQQGMREIEEYIVGEDSDQKLLGIFYIVFDPTKTKRAEAFRDKTGSMRIICDRSVNIVTVNISLPQPSKKA